MKFALPLLAALIAASGFADNLVPEAKRAFEVPFKGEGKMGLVYTPVFFPKGSEGAVIMTSRLSVELIQKTAKLGCGVLIGISAPTAMAIDMATRSGMTLVALARGDDYEIFTGYDRIKLGTDADAA